ncbi:MAG: hypothetical protein PHX47_00175 [Candidatus ainarchaeum sp.]|nr:hypothetical protein [Candidatus ainarchaeum sp.]
MVSVTLAVSKEIKEKMNKYNEINWSEFIRQKLISKINELDKIEYILKDEKKITEWSLDIQKKSRTSSNRFDSLKKMGLI